MTAPRSRLTSNAVAWAGRRTSAAVASQAVAAASAAASVEPALIDFGETITGGDETTIADINERLDAAGIPPI